MRLFVAVWPPPQVVEALAALPRPDVAGLRWTRPEQWHVTLRFLGEVDGDAAVDAFRAIERPGPGPVVAHVGPATGRFGRRVLHVPVAGLDELAAATVGSRLAQLGRPPERRPFAGHLTLARARSPRGVDLRPFVGAPVAGRWVVPEVTLVVSRLGPGGARYDVVDALPLPPAPPGA